VASVQITLSENFGVEIRLYKEHVARSAVTGGTRPKTQARYRAVFDKFEPFALEQGVRFWNDASARLLDRYAAWLDGEGYAYRTEFLELTTIKQAVNWMILDKHLPEACRLHLPLTDIDLTNNLITLTDETATVVRQRTRKARQIKNRRGRSFPIHQNLRQVLERIERQPGGLVFHGPRNGVPSPDICRRTLIKEILTPLAKQFPTPEGGRLQGRPAPQFSTLFLLGLRQHRRAGAGSDAVAGPPGQQDGQALLPPTRRRGPAANAA
jgi:hypothetical protein